MRLRLRDRRGDEGVVAEVRQGLAGVGEVRTGAVTGSILITYAGEEAGVLEALRGRGLDVREAAPAAVAVRRAEPRELPTALDMTAIGLAAAGLVQVARGQVVG